MSTMGRNHRDAPLGGLLLCGALLAASQAGAAETQLVPEPDAPPTITVEQPVNPTSSAPGGPILLSMTARLGPAPLNTVPQSIIPEFHFVAPSGNAVLLRRELVSTSGNNVHLNPASVINIPPDAQKKGAVISGGWSCHNGQYAATISAFIVDMDGARSNPIQYTVHCHGG